jgi:hypothetical protein
MVTSDQSRGFLLAESVLALHHIYAMGRVPKDRPSKSKKSSWLVTDKEYRYAGGPTLLNNQRMTEVDK